VNFCVPFRFRVNYVSENTSAHNAHQKPTDNTRTDADLPNKKLPRMGGRKTNPTSEAHYDGTFPTTSRTTTNANGIRQLTAEIWDQENVGLTQLLILILMGRDRA
jgi:hypothetical protein